MGSSRESQDIIRALKYENFKRFWYLIKNFNRLTYDDTFMPLVCKILGHKPYQPVINEPEWACRRCHRFIKKLL